MGSLAINGKFSNRWQLSPFQMPTLSVAGGQRQSQMWNSKMRLTTLHDRLDRTRCDELDFSSDTGILHYGAILAGRRFDRRFRGAIELADNPVVHTVGHTVQGRVRTPDGDRVLDAADHHVLFPTVQVVHRFQRYKDVRMVGEDEVDLSIDRLAEHCLGQVVGEQQSRNRFDLSRSDQYADLRRKFVD